MGLNHALLFWKQIGHHGLRLEEKTRSPYGVAPMRKQSEAVGQSGMGRKKQAPRIAPGPRAPFSEPMGEVTAGFPSRGFQTLAEVTLGGGPIRWAS